MGTKTHTHTDTHTKRNRIDAVTRLVAVVELAGVVPPPAVACQKGPALPECWRGLWTNRTAVSLNCCQPRVSSNLHGMYQCLLSVMLSSVSDRRFFDGIHIYTLRREGGTYTPPSRGPDSYYNLSDYFSPAQHTAEHRCLRGSTKRQTLFPPSLFNAPFATVRFGYRPVLRYTINHLRFFFVFLERNQSRAISF